MKHPLHSQRGVAVITALLLTTLAVTIVASLFWQQQVQVRSIENQRTQLQKQWILRGALDWARLILDESGKSNQGRDDLQQPWAVGLAETRLDSYVENGRSGADASDATITGKIIDAQSYFNLTGLAASGVPQPEEIKAFERLLTLLRVEPTLALVAARGVAAGQGKNMQAAAGGANSALVPASDTQPGSQATGQQAAATQEDPKIAVQPTAAATGQMGITQVEDLLALPGFTPEIIAKLKNFIIILPVPTLINVNTASAEVLAARFGVPISTGQAIVAQRTNAAFTRDNDFTTRAQLPTATGFSVKTNYFIVDGRVKMSRAALEVLALIERKSGSSPTGPIPSTVLWIHEN